MTTRIAWFSLVATLASTSGAAPADPKSMKKQCIADNESAQTLRDEHKLRRARELFLACAADACPAVIRKDCATSALDLEKRIPTLMIRAKDESGADLVAVKVTIDDEVVLASLDGKPLAVDPGVHRVRLETEGFPVNEQQVVVGETDRDRAISVTFAKPKVVAPAPPAPPPPTKAPPRTIPTGAWVIGGAGVVALGVGGVFYGLGLSQRTRETDAGCATTAACDDAKSSIRTKLIVGDVLVGVGVVAITSSVIWAIRAKGAEPEAPRTSLDVQPMRGGAFATATITF